MEKILSYGKNLSKYHIYMVIVVIKFKTDNHEVTHGWDVSIYVLISIILISLYITNISILLEKKPIFIMIFKHSKNHTEKWQKVYLLY